MLNQMKRNLIFATYVSNYFITSKLSYVPKSAVSKRLISWKNCYKKITQKCLKKSLFIFFYNLLLTFVTKDWLLHILKSRWLITFLSFVWIRSIVHDLRHSNQDFVRPEKVINVTMMAFQFSTFSASLIIVKSLKIILQIWMSVLTSIGANRIFLKK